jgi:hypothetical protein
VPIAAEPPQQHQLPRTAQPGPTWRQQALVLLGTTSFLTALFMCQVFSLLFTTVSRAPLPAVCLPCHAANRCCHGLMVSAGLRQLTCAHLPAARPCPCTQAYLSQMVFLLAPVMVALIAKALFK